jgi:hypothetical protein
LLVWKDAKLKINSVDGHRAGQPKLAKTRVTHRIQLDFQRQYKLVLSSVGQVQPELTFRALSHLVIVFLGIILVALSLVSMWKENRFDWPLRVSSDLPSLSPRRETFSNDLAF